MMRLTIRRKPVRRLVQEQPRDVGRQLGFRHADPVAGERLVDITDRGVAQVQAASLLGSCEDALLGRFPGCLGRRKVIGMRPQRATVEPQPGF